MDCLFLYTGIIHSLKVLLQLSYIVDFHTLRDSLYEKILHKRVFRYALVFF